jgi:hypothetical protein
VTRAFTDEECRAAGLITCSDPREPVASGLLIAGGDDAYGGGPSAQTLAGASVKLVANREHFADMQANFEPFTEQTGIEVVIRAVRRDEDTFRDALDPDDADILEISQPGAIPKIAPGAVMDLARYLDRDELEMTQSPYLTSLVSLGDDGSWPSTSGPV